MFLKGRSSNSRTSFNASIHSRSCSFRSQLLLLFNVLLLLITLPSRVSSSPTPSTSVNEQQKINDDAMNLQTNAAFMLDGPGSEEDFSSSASSSVQRPAFSSATGAAPSFLWYAQPRAHANQFLVSPLHDKDILVPKWFTRYSQDDLDDMDDDLSDRMLLKRSTFLRNTVSYPILKKRKQLTKPPMEVMNEIVNSIYL